MKHAALTVGLLITLAACSRSAPPPPAPGVKLGKPYTVDGVTYTPEYEPDYDKTGMASWYGPGFHGHSTANGETFDQDGLTAAHPTLPLPCLVRVTNLENGKSEIIRVNDRGPFKSSRLIDLSRASAETLGITGLAKVRVQYLKQETEEYWAKMNLEPGDIQFADADGLPRSGAIIAAEPGASSSPQVKQAAPVMSVAAQDLDPFSVIADAQAAEADETAPAPAAAQLRENVPARIPFGHGPSVPAPDAAAAAPDEAPPQNPPRAHVELKLYNSEGKEIPPVPAAELESQPVKLKPYNSQEDIIAAAEQEAAPPAPPAALAKPSREESNPAPSHAESGNGWYIQAGSFSVQANAQKLANRLSRLGHAAVTAMEVGGQMWHRVRLGPFASRAEAEQTLAAALAEGANGAKLLKL